MFDRSYLPSAGLEFVVIGDTHYILDPEIYASNKDSQDVKYTRNWSKRAMHALELAASLEADFAIHLGDLEQEYPGKGTFIQSRKKALGQIRNSGLNPYHVAGNMDIGDKPNAISPAPWVRKEDIDMWHEQLGRSWYSFNHQDVHCIVLNTQIMNGPLNEAQSQENWFNQDIANHYKYRIFLFLHTPPFTVDKDEPGFGSYNNLDEPVRKWILDAVYKYKVELICAGHTHTAAFNHIGHTRFWIVPSTTTSRPTFNEVFTILPEHRGKNDLGKLGFYLARSQSDGVRMHLIRTDGSTKQTSKNAPVKRLLTRVSHDLKKSPLGVNLRLPLAPTTLGVQAWPDVVRQRMRDDYPLLACIEMGARHLRLPASDLSDRIQSERIAIARSEGMQITATWLWSEILEVDKEITKYSNLVDFIEIQIPGKLTRTHPIWTIIEKCRDKTHKPIGLAPLLAQEQVSGKYHPRTRTGFLPAELVRLNQHLDNNEHDLDRAVCTINADTSTWDTMQLLETLLPLNRIGAIDIIVPLPETNDTVHERIVAESLFASTVLPNCRLFLDPLVDVDRSSDINNGLLDRLSNPRTPFHIARCLNTILFSQSNSYNLAPNSTTHTRGITSDKANLWLLFPGHDIDTQTFPLGRNKIIPDTTWIDLVLGTSQLVSDRGQFDNLASQLEQPALLKTELSTN